MAIQPLECLWGVYFSLSVMVPFFYQNKARAVDSVLGNTWDGSQPDRPRQAEGAHCDGASIGDYLPKILHPTRTLIWFEFRICVHVFYV